MAGFNVEDTAELDKAAGIVSDTNENITANLKELGGKIDAAFQGWGGSAAKAFGQLMEQFTDRAGKLNAEINDLGEKLRAAGGTYATKEYEQEAELKALLDMDN